MNRTSTWKGNHCHWKLLLSRSPAPQPQYPANSPTHTFSRDAHTHSMKNGQLPFENRHTTVTAAPTPCHLQSTLPPCTISCLIAKRKPENVTTKRTSPFSANASGSHPKLPPSRTLRPTRHQKGEGETVQANHVPLPGQKKTQGPTDTQTSSEQGT